MREKWKTAAAVLFWLAVWQLAAMAIRQQLFLPTPASVLAALAELVPTADFWRRVGFSLARIAGGFFLAAAAAAVLVALAAALDTVEVLLRPLILVVKTTPVASFIILALVWLPSRNLSVFISFLMVLPVVYTATLAGIRHTDPQLLEMARVFRLPPARRVRAIYLPETMPYFVSACSTALGLAWKSGVAAEVIGLPDGSIGEALYQAKVFLTMPELFAWTVVIILASMLFERAVLRLLRWAAARIAGTKEAV